jgi:hypothetical protein
MREPGWLAEEYRRVKAEVASCPAWMQAGVREAAARSKHENLQETAQYRRFLEDPPAFAS